MFLRFLATFLACSFQFLLVLLFALFFRIFCIFLNFLLIFSGFFRFFNEFRHVCFLFFKIFPFLTFSAKCLGLRREFWREIAVEPLFAASVTNRERGRGGRE